MRAHTIRTPQGFTLIELVVALLLLSIVALAITSLNGNLFLKSTYMRDLQQGNTLLQACVDQVLAQRKGTGGFGSTFACAAPQNTEFSLTVTVTAPASQPSFCANVFTSAKCKKVDIQVKRTVNGSVVMSTAPVSLMFVNY